MFVIPDRARILYYGDDTKNVEADTVWPEEYDLLPKLREYMIAVMRLKNGIGLAAPQVGIFRQYFIIRIDDGRIVDCLNPEVIQMYGHEIDGFEACLSIPPVGNGCKVPRPQKIKIEFETSQNPHWREVYELQGMDAVVAQHELDHLTGTFFIDRVNDVRKKEVLRLFGSWRIQQAIYLASKEKHLAENRTRPFTADCR